MKTFIPNGHQERRRYPRTPAAFEVQIESTTGVCFDISPVGMRIKTAWSLPVGLQLRIELTGLTPGNAWILATIVHWYNREGEVGVRFVRVPPEAGAVIAGLIGQTPI